MNLKLLAMYMDSVQVKSFYKRTKTLRVADKIVLSLFVVSLLLLLAKIAGEEIAIWILKK